MFTYLKKQDDESNADETKKTVYSTLVSLFCLLNTH